MSGVIKIRVAHGYGSQYFVDEDNKSVKMPPVFSFVHDGMDVKCVGVAKHYPKGHGEPAFDGNEVKFMVNGARIYIRDFFEVKESLSEIAKITKFY